MRYHLRSHGLFNLQLMSNSIGNALFTNALFTAPARFKFPVAAAADNADNSNEKSCSITVKNKLNTNKVRINLSIAYDSYLSYPQVKKVLFMKININPYRKHEIISSNKS